MIKGVKDSGERQPGSHLNKLNYSLDDPLAVGEFSTSAKQERGRREEEDAADVKGQKAILAKILTTRMVM